MKNWIIATLFMLCVAPAFGQQIVQIEEGETTVEATFSEGYEVQYRLHYVDPVAQGRELFRDGTVPKLATTRTVRWNPEEGIAFVFEYRYLDSGGNWTDWRSSEASAAEE